MNFPNESPNYRSARDQLLLAEIELRRQVERVAELRRSLPSGGEVREDYEFDSLDGPVKLSQLFEKGDTLVIYGFMYGPEMPKACSSCTSILDSLDGAAHHLAQVTNLVAIAKSPLPRILEHAKTRGWTRLRLLSSERNTYNRDYGAETADGAQMPMLNVFRKNGMIHHFWGSELLFAKAEPGQDPRHGDSIWPLWNVLDLTPRGRGTDFYPKLRY